MPHVKSFLYPAQASGSETVGCEGIRCGTESMCAWRKLWEGWCRGLQAIASPGLCAQVQERALAAEKGYPSPVYDTIEDTHANYKACTLKLLDDIANSEVRVCCVGALRV